MAYCGGATQANANYLASKTGLDPRVALAWLKNECQSVANPTNPLNILYYGTNGQTGQQGRFGTYPSTQAGLDAAARLINNSANYSVIRAAIKTGNPVAEAHAIELSPWAGGHYGGTSTRYGGITRTLANIMGIALPGLSGGNTTPSNVNPGYSPTAVPAPAFLSDPNHVITEADADILTKYILSIQDPARAAGLSQYLKAVFHPDFGSGQSSAIGMKVGDFKTTYSALFTPNSDSVNRQIGTGITVPDIPGAIGGAVDAFTKAVGVFFGLALIGFGVFIYGKSVRSRQVVETA